MSPFLIVCMNGGGGLQNGVRECSPDKVKSGVQKTERRAWRKAPFIFILLAKKQKVIVQL